MMRVGIVGLGLIGGSFAKAYHAAGWEVLAMNRSRSVLEFAKLSGDVNGELTCDNISSCDLVLLTIYPEACITALRELAPYICEKPLVIDCCGTKRVVCEACFPVADEYGFTFVGGHQMAGKKFSGYEYSTGDLYRDSSMIVVPEDTTDSAMNERLAKAFLPCRIGMLTVTTAEKHDAMIAFTSEMPHIISNAFIKSPTAREHDGFSAGSYKDLTRVAWLNETMWTEIFLENRDNIIKEIDYIQKHLADYKAALEKGDAQELWNLLHEGKIAKEEVDGI